MDIKKHLRDHKAAYYCAATGIVVAGITTLIMRSNIARGGMGGTDARGGLSNTASLNLVNRQSITAITVLEREGRGHPGWPVRNLETKHVFLSQKAAAEAFGVPEGTISGHLNGKFPDVDGLHFERVSLGGETNV